MKWGNINFRHGMFRLWLVISVVWIVFALMAITVINIEFLTYEAREDSQMFLPFIITKFIPLIFAPPLILFFGGIVLNFAGKTIFHILHWVYLGFRSN